jgi:uncharacterized membrane protein YfbV (UPF0208 family)
MENSGIYLVPLTTALVQMVKNLELMPSKFMAVVALVIGALIGFSTGERNIISLIMIGLSASGLYETGKMTVTEVKKQIK